MFIQNTKSFTEYIEARFSIFNSQTLPLPGHDSRNCKVVLWRIGVYDPHKFSMDDTSRAAWMLADILMEEDESMSIAGTVSVLDMAGATSAHMLQMTPALAKKSLTVWQVCISVLKHY